MRKNEKTITASDLLGDYKQKISQVAVGEIPTLIGNLEELKAVAWVRLVETTNGGNVGQGAASDQLLKAKEAARRLNVSEDYLYRNSRSLPFTVRIGKRLRFSAQGIQNYIKLRQQE